MKMEQLDDGNWLIDGVEFGPVDKQPRELPAQPIDPDQLPVRVTLRNGLHYTAVELSRSGNGVMCVESQRSGHWIVVNVDGHFNTEKQPVGSDVIHVGKWLTTEELEEMRNEQR